MCMSILLGGGSSYTSMGSMPSGRRLRGWPYHTTVSILKHSRKYWDAPTCAPFGMTALIYAMAMPGQFYRSKDGMHGFEPGPILFNPNMRHSAVMKRSNELWVFWTQVGDVPERILLSRVDLTGNWHSWKV